jgi:hypothetical protein
LSNGLPNFNFNTNPTSGEPLNLWYFADDYETADNNLTFSFCNTPAIGAGVTINQNRYLNIAPDSDWEDQTDVCIEVEDEEGRTAQETFSIIKGELNQRLYLPLIRH